MASRYHIIVRAHSWILIIFVFVVLIVCINKRNKILKLSSMRLLVRRYFFITDLKKILHQKRKYLQTIIGLNHIVECIDSKIVINNFLFILTFLVCKLQVDINYFLDLFAALLDLLVPFVDLIHHLRVEGVIFVTFEWVLLKDWLSVLPDTFLDVLNDRINTVTRMRISWSR